MTKKATSIRLSDEALALREKLSKKLGVDLTSVMELAIRLLAEREKVQ